MTESKERIRVLRQVEHGVLSKVENANGIVTLLKELGRENETTVAVAATHCLRRAFAQLLDPAKNPQLPRPAPVPSMTSRGVTGTPGENGSEGKKKKKKKRARSDDDGGDDDGDDGDGGDGGVSTSERIAGGEGRVDDEGDKAAKVYQAWLEARYFDFLRVLLGWVAEVDDFHRQGPALRTLMQFVEMEPRLCVSAAKFSRAGRSDGGGGTGGSGEGTIWGGLFAELVRMIVLGPCSMQPKLLQALGEDYVNVHDDIRYFLLSSITAIARQALADDEKRKEQEQKHQSSSSSSSSSAQAPHFLLPADSPLRGFQGAASAFTDRGVGGSGAGAGGKRAAAPASVDAPKRKKRRNKTGQAEPEDGVRDDADALVVEAAGGAQRMGLAEINGRLARVLMVVRMVEEQSDLTAFLLPVRLSLPSSSSSSSLASLKHGKPEVGDGGDQELEGDASSSSDSSDEDDEEGGGGAGRAGKGKDGKKVVGKGKGMGGRGGGAGEAASGKKGRMLAIERLRYHKKAFGDAWLACLRLPLPPALYRRVLLFLPGNVIPYMPSPVRLADFLTAAYGLGGVQSVLALDALFLLMQSHDLDYPDFYDSLYRLVTSDMMYAKYRARFFRMVDLCLSSSHVPAYVVAAFLKRFSRATLQAPPSGALFTLALVRKLIGRHPECLPLISSKPAPISRTVDRLLTSSGALSGTTGTKNRPLVSPDAPSGSSGGGGGGDGGTPADGAEAGGGFVDEYDPACEDSKGAGAMQTSLWELAALQNHYHPAVATLARGFLREADKKEAEGEAFAGPSKLAGETYQTLFEQEMRRKIGDTPLAFRRPKGLFDDIPEEGGGVFAAVNFSIS